VVENTIAEARRHAVRIQKKIWLELTIWGAKEIISP
jgi:hypothetical protein